VQNPEDNEQRILVLAAINPDAILTEQVLREASLQPTICEDLQELCQAIKYGVGAILVAEEMLFPKGLDELKEALNKQEPWSEIPVIVITCGGDLTQSAYELIQAQEILRNVTLLERPVRLFTLVSIVKSVLKSRQRQYQMRDLLEKCQSSTEAAQAANKAKSYFLANMSHEIRTPLGVIMGFSELLLDEETDSEDRVEFVNAIHRNGKLLTQIIDDILDLSKVEADKLTIESIPCSLPELMADVESLMKRPAQQKNIQLLLQIADAVPNVIHTDPTRLKQILINIIGNAIKFTNEGQVTVQVRRKDDVQLEFVVQDTGRGISKEHQKMLFQPFSQADITTTRKFGGTGLGLVLSRRLAEALGGGLELTKSEEDIGSIFTITLGFSQEKPGLENFINPPGDGRRSAPSCSL
jgi:signal transduction histidine kinase